MPSIVIESNEIHIEIRSEIKEKNKYKNLRWITTNHHAKFLYYSLTAQPHLSCARDIKRQTLKALLHPTIKCHSTFLFVLYSCRPCYIQFNCVVYYVYGGWYVLSIFKHI